MIPGYEPNDFTPITIKTNFIGNYDSRLSIITSHNGQERETPFEITLTSKDISNPLIAETPKNLEFLRTDDNKNWTIRKGLWNINSPLVINGNLTIEEGTTVRMSKNSRIIVDEESYIFSNGTAENPVNIISAENGYWRGVLIQTNSAFTLYSSEYNNLDEIKSIDHFSRAKFT